MITIRDLSVYDSLPVPYGNYDGLIIRCYNGNGKDAAFEIHKAGAQSAGKPWWAYAFYNFNYTALKQVQDVVDILKVNSGDLPCAFDVEEWGGHIFPARDVLLQNLQVIYSNYKALTGKNCQFYMNPSAIHYLKPIPDWLLNCPLWIAHWGAPHPDFEPWAKWTFWQKSGEPDLSVFNGTDAEYWTYVNASPPIDKLAVLWRENTTHHPDWNWK
jgi:GH25 family lysozyme M1 (1,4-beta-N-acetylmuramidase)